MAISAIETQYAGCWFRSRLEARWAVFFDSLGIRWEYEPDGFSTSAGPYLPDFWIQLPQVKRYHETVWFEVKPDNALVDPRHAALALESDKPVIVAKGMPRDYSDQLRGEASPIVVYYPTYITMVECPTCFDDYPLWSHERCPNCETVKPVGDPLRPVDRTTRVRQTISESGAFVKNPTPINAFYCALGDDRHWCQEHFGSCSMEGDPHLALWCASGETPRGSRDVDRAYRAARSARFEFGQSGGML